MLRKYKWPKTFQDISNVIDKKISEGSCWVIQSVDSKYDNISVSSPLWGSFYVELPDESRSSKKSLINIKNDDSKCFLWCHVRHLNQYI